MSTDRTERVELTTLCLLSRGDEILLQNRVKTDWRGYCFPGGRVEPGESVVSSVIREMKEETGLTVHAPKLCGIKQFPIDYMILGQHYVGNEQTGTAVFKPTNDLSALDEYYDTVLEAVSPANFSISPIRTC